MKKKTSNILIAVLIILQIYSLAKIHSLQNRIESTNNKMSSIENQLGSQIASIYQNVDQKLKEQASLIYASSIRVGQLDVDALTVPVTFTVEPKSVTETMAVFLDFEGDIVRLKKEDLKYFVTKDFKISDSIFSRAIIEDNGVKSVEESRGLSVSNVKEQIFPYVFARFNGESGYGSNEYRTKGQLSIDYKPSQSNNYFVEIKYVAKVDGEVIKETDLISENRNAIIEPLSLDLDDKYSLNKGQTFTSYITAVDNLGFIHEYLIMRYEAGSNMQREPYFEQEAIIAPGGEPVYMFDESNQ